MDKRLLTSLLTVLIVVMSVYYIFFNGAMLFKLIPMALIILYGVTLLPKRRETYHYLTLIGLLFCITGDYTLQWFIVGLFSFLIGHIFYIFSFRRQKSTLAKKDSFRIIISIYALIMMSIMTVFLVKDANYAFVVPVILYTSIIAYMAYTAWQTKQIWLIVGSLLFLISDSILAWNKFVGSIEFSGVLIMVTYYSAQYCIATSLKHYK